MADRTQLQNLTSYHRQLIDDARNYSLPLRIAQLLIKDGFTEATVATVLNGRDPLENQIRNHVRDIEQEHFLHGQNPRRLRKLAEQLR
jgi:hypothetical protein